MHLIIIQRLKVWKSILFRCPNFFLVSIALVCWGVLLSMPHSYMPNMPSSHDMLGMSHQASPSFDSFIYWSVMVFCMMLPTLSTPLMYVWNKAFTPYQLVNCLSFVLIYTLTWSLFGQATLLMIGHLQQYIEMNLIFDVVIFIGLVWQASPYKQYANIARHRMQAINPFSSIRSCAKFGFVHAIWCIGSCWAIMLLPMLTPYHVAMMIVATGMIFYEYSKPYQRPRWRVPFLDKPILRSIS